jgi:succinate dehydrogenase flavin-adding protein (antitoxin of CptAB toxin-antitoxin module)
VVARNQLENIHFSTERGMRTMNWITDFFVHMRWAEVVCGKARGKEATRKTKT